ncbi:MAG: transposase [Candidatus Hydrogenedentota bacterium]
MGIEEVRTAPHSPWQNPYSERLNGSIRRECLDHIIIFSEGHLRQALKKYFEYYNRYRVHRSLEMDSPEGRPAQAVNEGKVIAIPHVGGLHHHYERKAAWPLKTKADQFSGPTAAISAESCLKC